MSFQGGESVNTIIGDPYVPSDLLGETDFEKAKVINTGDGVLNEGIVQEFVDEDTVNEYPFSDPSKSTDRTDSGVNENPQSEFSAEMGAEVDSLGLRSFVEQFADIQNSPEFGNQNFFVIRNGKPYWVAMDYQSGVVRYKFLPLNERASDKPINSSDFLHYEIDRTRGFITLDFASESAISPVENAKCIGVSYFDRRTRLQESPSKFSGFRAVDMTSDEKKKLVGDLLPNMDELLDAKNGLEISAYNKRLNEIRQEKRIAFSQTLPDIQIISNVIREKELLLASTNQDQSQIASLDERITQLRSALAEKTHQLLSPIVERENQMLFEREELRQLIRTRNNGEVPELYRLGKPDFLPGQFDHIVERKRREEEEKQPKPIVPINPAVDNSHRVRGANGSPTNAPFTIPTVKPIRPLQLTQRDYVPSVDNTKQDQVEEVGDYPVISPLQDVNNHRVNGVHGSPTAAPVQLADESQLPTREKEVRAMTGMENMMIGWAQDKEKWGRIKASTEFTEFVRAKNTWNQSHTPESWRKFEESSENLYKLAITSDELKSEN